MTGAIRVSRRGAAFGLAKEAVYLYAYPDPGTGGEPWTIGGGHTRGSGPPSVRPGDRVSLERAMRIYRSDLTVHERRVLASVPPQEQHEFDALVLFDMNTGKIDGQGGGTVDDRLRAGDVDGAMRTLRLYVNAGGRYMRGLDIRRQQEEAIYRRAEYPDQDVLVYDRPGARPMSVRAETLPWDAPEPTINPEVMTPPPVPDRATGRLEKLVLYWVDRFVAYLKTEFAR